MKITYVNQQDFQLQFVHFLTLQEKSNYVIWQLSRQNISRQTESEKTFKLIYTEKKTGPAGTQFETLGFKGNCISSVESLIREGPNARKEISRSDFNNLKLGKKA